MEKNKKLVPIIVVLAVVVLAGAWWAWDRYQKQRAARQFVGGLEKALSGENLGDLQKFAEEMNKAAGQGAAGQGAAEAPAEEAAVEDPYQSAEEVTDTGAFVGQVNAEIKPVLAQIFGGVKLTSYFSNAMGAGEDSGTATFTVARKISSNDTNKMTEALTSAGYQIISSSQDESAASILAKKNEKNYSFGWDKDSQEVVVVVVVLPGV